MDTNQIKNTNRQIDANDTNGYESNKKKHANTEAQKKILKHRNSVTSVSADSAIPELKGQLARALADYDNLRKRTEVEKEFWLKFASERVLTKLIPALDNFESALYHLKDPGLAIAVGEFKKVFEEEGLDEIRPQVGDSFDTNLHEAVEAVAASGSEGLRLGEKEEGKIVELILPGWKFKEGQVLRHAKVKVYA